MSTARKALRAGAQVWQARPLTELIDSLLAQYSPHAQWRWADCVSEHLARSPWSNAAGQRPLVVQHQQSDLALLQRLLREEGLVLRFERDTDTVVLLADTTREANCPALPDSPVRFHRDDATEPGDTVQALGSQRVLPTFTLTALASQHGAAASTAASTPSLADGWGPSSPRIEAYLHLGEVAWGQEGQGMTGAQADRALSLAQAGWEVQHKRFIGRSTVRSLHAGLRFELQGSALDAELPLKGNDPAQRTLLASSVAHVGINNLPKGLSAQIAGLTGVKASKDTNPHAEVLPPWVGPELRRQAAKSGYANAFAAHRCWRRPKFDPPTAIVPM
ncbi:MAG: contractile injection system protein, VgrG/Pvc8 family, partial [Inhella sp.]